MEVVQEIKRAKTRTVRRTIEYKGRTIKVEATYGLSQHENQAPYFSLTGSVWEKRENGRFPSEPDSSGQVVEEILAAFPWLALMARAHLNNALTGEPLWAAANAWFWYSADKYDATGRPTAYPEGYEDMTRAERAATYLGVDPSFFDGVEDKEDFVARVDLLRPTWARLAQDVLDVYALQLPDKVTP